MKTKVGVLCILFQPFYTTATLRIPQTYSFSIKIPVNQHSGGIKTSHSVCRLQFKAATLKHNRCVAAMKLLMHTAWTGSDNLHNKMGKACQLLKSMQPILISCSHVVMVWSYNIVKVMVFPHHNYCCCKLINCCLLDPHFNNRIHLLSIVLALSHCRPYTVHVMRFYFHVGLVSRWWSTPSWEPSRLFSTCC